MSTKWTPGPWKISRISATTIEGPAGRSVATSGGYSDNFSNGQDQADNVANAHLIAAAPTMAEYIKRKADEGCGEASAIWEAINGR